MDFILSLDDDLIPDDLSENARDSVYGPVTPPTEISQFDAVPDYDDLLYFEDDETEVASHGPSQLDLHEIDTDVPGMYGSLSGTNHANVRKRNSRHGEHVRDDLEAPADDCTEVDDEEDEGEEEEIDIEEEGEDEEEGTRDTAISRIEGLVTNFLEQLANISSIDGEDAALSGDGKKIEIKLARRRGPDVDGDETPGTRSLKWPNRRAKGASGLPLARLMGVLNVAHESLVTDLPTTKRDMFYQDVGLFGSQREVDQLTDDLAATFQLDRSDLNLRASGKGLLCGDGLKIVLGDGSSVSATNTDPILIPQAEDIQRFELNHEIEWLLVVEKEAVFQTMCRLSITNHPFFPGPGIIITGKGYPDVATRQLVATLSNNLPESVPIMVMVDGDAYGLDIASVYKFGSDALKHEAHKLVAERVECIGLFASELEAYGVSEDAMLPTTKADEKKAQAMLKRTKNLPDRWRRELEDMLRTHRKAEIEVLSATTTAADLDLGQEDTQRSQKRVHPLVRYLSEKIAASVAASTNVQMKVEED